jgi:hypothetical protein
MGRRGNEDDYLALGDRMESIEDSLDELPDKIAKAIGESLGESLSPEKIAKAIGELDTGDGEGEGEGGEGETEPTEIEQRVEGIEKSLGELKTMVEGLGSGGTGQPPAARKQHVEKTEASDPIVAGIL